MVNQRQKNVLLNNIKIFVKCVNLHFTSFRFYKLELVEYNKILVGTYLILYFILTLVREFMTVRHVES